MIETSGERLGKCGSFALEVETNSPEPSSVAAHLETAHDPEVVEQ